MKGIGGGKAGKVRPKFPQVLSGNELNFILEVCCLKAYDKEKTSPGFSA